MRARGNGAFCILWDTKNHLAPVTRSRKTLIGYFTCASLPHCTGTNRDKLAHAPTHPLVRGGLPHDGGHDSPGPGQPGRCRTLYLAGMFLLPAGRQRAGRARHP
ncbi:hypothetical protein Ga0080559_TMP3403 [Salipiger profundus]|uniref:Uncharacterized protein n=1 Tax=Salipiger profundus TaxID=1229727 RepID=A0A1U7D7U3_9RHOB|nr:hypothetical protein Ga0080559_TMP3403 [Salipiger profundus]